MNQKQVTCRRDMMQWLIVTVIMVVVLCLGPGCKKDEEKVPLQKNLWAISGSGSAPRL